MFVFDMKGFQFKIFLEGISPKIWRRFVVGDSLSFDDFHGVIQRVMGWENYHLYEFDVGGVKITPDDGEADYDFLDSKKVSLRDYLKEKQRFNYLYDFGDCWRHRIVFEKIVDCEDLPKCVDGERACPPEDCGGGWGYEEMMEISKDKKHPEYEEKIVEWLGEDFDFEKFDLEEVNKGLGVSSFWEEGGRVESVDVNSPEFKESMKYFKQENESLDFECALCGKKIGGHNKYWHKGMCDDCDLVG
ncbi:MAG: plasmid pRiA4b ORF-3 family protein [Nanoarchaeota archaeon]|nr:plasmid pRiA4b ORF-3 family protein [Nanoarchaeota archaeon]